jgi:hypothetical protein
LHCGEAKQLVEKIVDAHGISKERTRIRGMRFYSIYGNKENMLTGKILAYQPTQ